MQLATFTPGTQIRLHDEIYNVSAWEAETKKVLLVSDAGVRREFELAVLLDQYQIGNARPVADGKAFRDAAQARSAARQRIQQVLLSDLSEEDLKKVEFRLRLLRWLEAREIALSKTSILVKAMSEFKAEHEIPKTDSMPSLTTLQNWRRRLWAGHGDPASLRPRYDLRGGAGGTRLQPEVEDLMKRCLDNFFLTSERQSARKAHQMLVGDVAAANRFKSEPNRLRCPGLMTFMRRIEAMPAYNVFAARYGKQAADHRFRSATTGTSNRFGFMEAWEMDHTVLDVIVIDQESGLALGRPRLTLIIEVRSRMVMGFTIGLDGMSAIASLECLKRAVLPKNRGELQKMGVKGAWSAFGVPLALIMDNGADFHSKALRAALIELGIEAHYAPRKKAWFKGAVERAIQSFCKEGTGYLPGATVTPHARAALGLDKDASLDPSKLAVIDLDQLNSVLHRWVVDQHIAESKKALREMSPAQFWDAHATPERVQVPEDVERLSMICTLKVTRVIKTTGIDLCNVQTFNSPELQKVRRDHGHKGIEVQVCYSPRKLDKLWFKPPGTNEWCAVVNSDPETRDLSELELKTVTAHQRAAAKDENRQITFSEARRELMQWARDMRHADTQAKRRLVRKLLGLSTGAFDGSDKENAVPAEATEKDKEGSGQATSEAAKALGDEGVPTSQTTGADLEKEVPAARSEVPARSPKAAPRKHTTTSDAQKSGAKPLKVIPDKPSPPAQPESFDEFDSIPLLERV